MFAWEWSVFDFRGSVNTVLLLELCVAVCEQWVSAICWVKNLRSVRSRRGKSGISWTWTSRPFPQDQQHFQPPVVPPNRFRPIVHWSRKFPIVFPRRLRVARSEISIANTSSDPRATTPSLQSSLKKVLKRSEFFIDILTSPFTTSMIFEKFRFHSRNISPYVRPLWPSFALPSILEET